MCYNDVNGGEKPMNEPNVFTAKQVGERVKERRTELNLSMGDLGKRLGVNKSTIQRYESKGVDPEKRYLVISLAEAVSDRIYRRCTSDNPGMAYGSFRRKGIR